MPKVGVKAQGQSHNEKMFVIRHGRASKRAPNAAEKAIETRVRQQGKAEVRPWIGRSAEKEGGTDV